MLLDPAALPGLSAFLASLGVTLGDDFVVDRERRILGTDGLAAVVELFKRGNPITDAPGNPIESGVVLPSARTVDVSREVPGVDADSIARTAPTCVGDGRSGAGAPRRGAVGGGSTTCRVRRR